MKKILYLLAFLPSFSYCLSANFGDSVPTTVTGDLSIKGNVTLNDDASDYTIVNGTFTLANSSSMTVTGALQTDGATKLNGNVTLNDANADYTIVKGTFTVETASATFTGNAQVDGTATLNGNVTLNDAAGDYTLVNGTFTLANSSSMTVTGDMQVNGNTTFANNISAKASLFVSSATTSIPLEIRGQGGTSTDTLFKITSSSVATMTGEMTVSNVPVGWATITSTFSRVDDSTFTVTDNIYNQTVFAKGRPIKYRDAGGTYVYGIVTAYTTGTVYIAGAPMTTSYDAEIAYADFSRVTTETFVIPGYFADAADTTLLANDLLMGYIWQKPPANLVLVSHKVKTNDSGAEQPAINVALNGATYLSSNSTVAESFVKTDTTNVTIANYDIQYGETLEIQTNAAGTKDDASNLTVICTFVLQ